MSETCVVPGGESLCGMFRWWQRVPVRGTVVPIMGSALDALFPETRRALLVGFFRRPGSRFFLREIARAVGKGHGAVQRELANLVDGGILERTVEQGRTYFSADPRSPVYPEIVSLVSKTAGAPIVLREALHDVAGVQIAFIFGSVAAGQQDTESDIDLAILGDATFRDITLAAGAAQQRLGREINPFVCAPDEFRRRLHADEPFVRGVYSNPKLFIVGTQDDLEAVVG